MFKDGRNAEVEEGRGKVIVGGGVTRQQWLDLEVRKQRLNSVGLTWMVEEVRKTQLLLEVQRWLKAQEQREFRSVEESGCREGEGTDETVAARGSQYSEWRVIFSYVKLEDTPRIRKKSRDS